VGTVLLVWGWGWVLWVWVRVRVIVRGDWVRVLRWLQGTRVRMQMREALAREDQAREDQRLREERQREDQQQRVGVVLGQVEACLRQKLGPPGQRDRQETLQRLLQLVRDRQVQLMEPWREEQKRQQREELLRQELLGLRRVLQQLRRVQLLLRQELHKLRRERAHIMRTSGPFQYQLVLQRGQENLDWRELDQLMDLWVTRDWPPLDKSLVELIRVRLRPSLGQGHATLLDVILGNNSKFKSESPHLDALLVFVSVILYASNHGKH